MIWAKVGRQDRIEDALNDLIDAASPYLDLAAPHEQPNYEKLSGAVSEARRVLGAP